MRVAEATFSIYPARLSMISTELGILARLRLASLISPCQEFWIQ